MTDDRQEAINKAILEIISDIKSLRITIEKMAYMPINRKHVMSPSELYQNLISGCRDGLNITLNNISTLYFELKDKE